jgi:transposase
MRYTCDLTDTEWRLIDYCFPKPFRIARPRKHSYRELLNAIFYLAKTACQWRNLPESFASWRTVYHYFRQWKRIGLLAAIHGHLREHLRVVAGRKRHASAGILDSQSVRSTESSDERGYDAGKKINGRKPHLLVDTMGLILLALVLPANIQDRDGAKQLLGGTLQSVGSATGQTHLGRRRLRGSPGELGTSTLALHRRDCETIAVAHLPSRAATLGSRAHLRLAWTLSPIESRLRAPCSDRRNHGLLGHDSIDAGAVGEKLMSFQTRSKRTGTEV